MDKPSLPSGTRDFGPDVMMRRKYLIGCIENTFKRYGFLPIETPALENLRTLQGKYGDEGDQLLFKVLNNGDFLAKADEKTLLNRDSKGLSPLIADRGLRYDLTVPLARFVVMNRDKISFPFRRYQMQPVWRADRPQKGRYREFWQCDADVLGSNGISNEADLISIYDDVFSELDLKVTIRLNHRRLLDAFGNWLQGTQNLGRFMQLIDKADKIGFDGVSRELEANEIPNGIEAWTFLHNTSQMDSPAAILEALQKQEPIENEHLQEGIASLTALFSILDKLKLNNKLQLDLTLARGLSYYTGCVLEVVPSDDRIPADFKIGSIGGGGRYDNLTEVFGLKDVSGVGISFGLDRIYDIIESARLFPTNALESTTILICAMDETTIPHAFSLAQSLRKAGIATEVYPTAAKLKKQLDYANAKGMHWAAIIGDQEMQSGMVTLKNLQSGEQQTIGQQAITEYIKP